jgi:hypothetical protein
MPTLYECGNCGQITNTVWNWANEQLCRVCFGIKRLGDYGSGGVATDKTVRLVKADGTVVDPTAARPVVPLRPVSQDVIAGSAASRKIRIPVKEGK